jgi:hypothetical protein
LRKHGGQDGWDEMANDILMVKVMFDEEIGFWASDVNLDGKFWIM